MALKRYPLVDRGGGSAAVVIQSGDIAVWSVPGSAAAAIVNATNQAMLGGGGVDGAIHAAAGPDLKKYCEAIPETRKSKKKKARCFTGEAVITPGFGLDVPYIIHTVGPNCTSMPPAAAAQLLQSAYRNVLNLARDQSITHIAFPAISCGTNGFPAQRAAEIALSACMENSGGLTEIHFVLDDPSFFTAWVMAADKLIPLPSAAVVDDATGLSQPCKRWLIPDQTASPNPDVSDKTKGKKTVLLRYMYSEIEQEFDVLPEDQGKTLEDVIRSKEFSKQVVVGLGPGSGTGIGKNVELELEVIPITHTQIKVVDFVRVGGRILFKPDARSQNDGRTFKQALKLQLLLDSKDYINYVAGEIKAQEQKPKPRLKLDSAHDAHDEKNVIKMLTELKEEFSVLKIEFGNLGQENSKLRERVTTLEQENNKLKERVTTLEQENSKLKEQIQVLRDFTRPFRVVIFRKLLEKFRTKATSQCTEAGLHVPGEWNEIAERSSANGRACATLVKLSPRALWLSRFGQGSLQAQAGASLHGISDALDTWPPRVYASYVTAAPHNLKTGLSDIYQFVFNRHPDNDAWE